jgi:hypothetical protein
LAGTVADLGWGEKVRLPELWDLIIDPDARVTFGKVVRAHDLARTHPDVVDEAAVVGPLLRAKFEAQQGVIHNSYFCEYLLGGCALVERITVTGRTRRVERRLHSVVNSPVGDLVALEARCVTLADEANSTLCTPSTRSSLESASEAIYAAMTRVLGAADRYADPAASDGDRKAALLAADREVGDASIRVRATIQRQTRFLYFQGALIGFASTIVLCAVLSVLAAEYWRSAVNPAALSAATVFGALGAIVSVFQRIAGGKLILDYHTSRTQLIQLGMLRPAVGATFGAVVQFGLVGGLLGEAGTNRAPDQLFGLFALLGFASGFSERFATDMIERAGQVISGSRSEPAPPLGQPGAVPAATPAGETADRAPSEADSATPPPPADNTGRQQAAPTQR